MFIVMSADRTENHYIVNLRNTLELVDIVESMGYAYQVGTGCYAGGRENCVVIDVPADRSSEAVVMASSLLDAYNQECILFVDDSTNGHLLYANGYTAFVGVWHAISKDEATKRDHTEIKGKFYACF